MIRLLLIRHAKSAWTVPGLADHARRLNDRGRRDAPRIGAWLTEQGLVPEHGLVSDAVRTRETWTALCASMGAVPASVVPSIYEAEPEALLAAIRAAPAVGRLALVGHNPGIGETARRLLARAPADEDFAKYPTSAVAVVDFDAEAWDRIDWRTGRLAAFVTPKTLGA